MVTLIGRFLPGGSVFATCEGRYILTCSQCAELREVVVLGTWDSLGRFRIEVMRALSHFHTL